MKEVSSKADVITGIFLWFRFSGEAFLVDAFFMLMLMVVCHFEEVTTEKGVDNGTEENDGGDDVEASLLSRAVFELIPHPPVGFLLFHLIIFREGKWKDGVAVFV